jgi:hypothetical protein
MSVNLKDDQPILMGLANTQAYPNKRYDNNYRDHNLNRSYIIASDQDRDVYYFQEDPASQKIYNNSMHQAY